MNGEGSRYLLPRPITRRFEIVPGWSLAAAGAVAASLAGGGGFTAGLLALHAPLPVALVPGVLVAGSGTVLQLPLPGQTETLWGMLHALRAWRRRPRRLLYDWTRRDV